MFWMRAHILAWFLPMLIFSSSSHAFVISAQDRCIRYQSSNEQTVYAYKFTDSVYSADYTVAVSSSSYSPDLKIKIVSGPALANLGLADNLTKSDMQVCKTERRQIGSKDITTIRVASNSYNPDIKIQLYEHVYNPDYVIYVDSDNFEVEEAAALFAVIWKSSRDKIKADEEAENEDPTLEELTAKLARQKAVLIASKSSIPRQIQVHKQNIIKMENHIKALSQLAKSNPMKIQEISNQMSNNYRMISDAKNEIYILEMELNYTNQALRIIE